DSDLDVLLVGGGDDAFEALSLRGQFAQNRVRFTLAKRPPSSLEQAFQLRMNTRDSGVEYLSLPPELLTRYDLQSRPEVAVVFHSLEHTSLRETASTLQHLMAENSQVIWILPIATIEVQDIRRANLLNLYVNLELARCAKKYLSEEISEQNFRENVGILLQQLITSGIVREESSRFADDIISIPIEKRVEFVCQLDNDIKLRLEPSFSAFYERYKPLLPYGNGLFFNSQEAANFFSTYGLRVNAVTTVGKGTQQQFFIFQLQNINLENLPHKVVEQPILSAEYQTNCLQRESLEELLVTTRSSTFESELAIAREKAAPFIERLGQIVKMELPDRYLDTAFIYHGIARYSWSILKNQTVLLPAGLISKETKPNQWGNRRYYEILIPGEVSNDVEIRVPGQMNLLMGLRNGWGFLSVPHQGPTEGSSAMISYSAIVIDQWVVDMLTNYSSVHTDVLLAAYAQLWDIADHDYLHHIFPNPRFSYQVHPGSPMKVEGNAKWQSPEFKAQEVDTNFERWAVLIHAEVVRGMQIEDTLILLANTYFEAIRKFQRELIAKNCKQQDVEKIGYYLSAIFISPMLLVCPPTSKVFSEIENGIKGIGLGNLSQLDFIQEAIIATGLESNIKWFSRRGLTGKQLSVEEKIELFQFVISKNRTRGEQTISSIFKELGFSESTTPESIPLLSNYQLLRLTTAILTRGYFEALHGGDKFEFMQGYSTIEALVQFIVFQQANLKNRLN
ncbi:MAG: hypothetical protein KBC84_11035, partial [Proteobacteria bacterium]|nr:hypothetical protein [Pseudomonadota bacterium]